MSRNAIIITSEPKGRFWEGTLGAITPKPGTCMQQASDGTIGVYTPGADGGLELVAVLLPDDLQGVVATGAYASGAHCFLYSPLPGDEMNMLVADVAGTGDTIAIGDLFIITNASGKLKATTGSPAMKSFKAREAVTTALAADTLVLMMYTGH